MHDVRIIPTDNSPHPKNYWAWDGDSRGRWEGDTLVVDVSNFNGRTWLDMAGNFVDQNEHVLERFTLLDADTIQYQATITDPTLDALYASSLALAAQEAREQRRVEMVSVVDVAQR